MGRGKGKGVEGSRGCTVQYIPYVRRTCIVGFYGRGWYTVYVWEFLCWAAVREYTRFGMLLRLFLNVVGGLVEAS